MKGGWVREMLLRVGYQITPSSVSYFVQYVLLFLFLFIWNQSCTRYCLALILSSTGMYCMYVGLVASASCLTLPLEALVWPSEPFKGSFRVRVAYYDHSPLFCTYNVCTYIHTSAVVKREDLINTCQYEPAEGLAATQDGEREREREKEYNLIFRTWHCRGLCLLTLFHCGTDRSCSMDWHLYM